MNKKLIQIMSAFILFFLSLLIPFENEWINKAMYLVSYVIIGVEVIVKAIQNIFKGEIFDENFLMLIATIGAICIGEYPEAVAVMLFFQVGELFQDYAVDKSKKSITNLMDIRPDFANVKRDGEIQKLNPNEVKIGEIIIVKPGEKIPLDGKVIEGTSNIDVKALTGESMPKEVNIGDEILSGSINQTGLITIKVTKEFGESTVSKILDLVQNASDKKSKSENFITKFAKYYTPIVVLIAVLLAIIPPLIFKNTEFTDWLYRALTFLVVSCPCALVISIPLGFFSGIGKASRKGILIKGGNYLEALSNTETVVFDKTGTLTKGKFEVQKIEVNSASNNITKEELLKIIAHAESYSNHPISISIKEAYSKEIDNNLVSNIEELSGLGISANVDGKNVLIGNEKLMISKDIQYEKCNENGTILYTAIDSKYSGYILVADNIKEDAKETIENLKKYSVKKTIMLTGDKKEVGEDVANILEIDKVYTELLPAEKAEKLEEILKQKSPKGKVVFIGDGINDAPVLAMADIGIAMGGLRSR